MNLSLCKRKACNGVINQSSFYLKYKTQLRPRKLLFLGDKLLFRSWRPGWCKHSDRERRGHRQSTPDQRSNGQRSGTIWVFKVQLFWEGHKNLRKSLNCFDATEWNSCFIKTWGRFFQILWPSHNILTLKSHHFWICRAGISFKSKSNLVFKVQITVAKVSHFLNNYLHNWSPFIE